MPKPAPKKRLTPYAGAPANKRRTPKPAQAEEVHTFEEVARFVCKGSDPPPALIASFQRWAQPEGYWGHNPVDEMTRREVVAALKELCGAAEIILKGLDTRAGNFILSPEYEVFDRWGLAALLKDIQTRCRAAVASSALSSANGRVKSGPGGVARVSGNNARTTCARAIVIAWREINKETPASRNRFVVKAADALYFLMTDPIKGQAPKERRTNDVGNPTDRWKKHFQAAKKQLPEHEWTFDVYFLILRAAFIEFGYPARRKQIPS